MPATTCSCGRGFSTRSGFANHARKCPVETARSAAWVDDVEAGRDPRVNPAARVVTPAPDDGSDWYGHRPDAPRCLRCGHLVVATTCRRCGCPAHADKITDDQVEFRGAILVEITRLEAENAEQDATIVKARELHAPHGVARLYCYECADDEADGGARQWWPCRTARLVYTPAEIEERTT